MQESNNRYGSKTRLIGVITIAFSAGLVANLVMANLPPPTEHKDISVTGLGEINRQSIATQLNLDGHKLQFREITIMPGGQIARHSHATRPGIVKVVSGTWTEGSPDGETEYSSESGVLLEDKDTEHWFYNLGEEPATAYVCDIVPDDS